MYTNKLLRLKPNYSTSTSEYTATLNTSIKFEPNSAIALRSIFLGDVKSQQIILNNDVKFSVQYKQGILPVAITVPKGSYINSTALAQAIQNSLNASLPDPLNPQDSVTKSINFTGFCWNCTTQAGRILIQFDHSAYTTPAKNPVDFTPSKCIVTAQKITPSFLPAGDGTTFAYPNNVINPGCGLTQWSYVVGNNNTNLQFLAGYVNVAKAGQSSYNIEDYDVGFGCDVDKNLYTIFNGQIVGEPYGTLFFKNTGNNRILNVNIYHKNVINTNIAQWVIRINYIGVNGTPVQLEETMGNVNWTQYLPVTTFLYDNYTLGGTESSITYDYLTNNPFAIFNTDGDLVDKPFVTKYASNGNLAGTSSIITFNFPQSAQDKLGFASSYVVSGSSGQISSVYGIENGLLNDIVVELNGVVCDSYDSSSEYGFSRAIIGTVNTIAPVGNSNNSNDYSVDIVAPPFISLKNAGVLELSNFNIRILSQNTPIECGDPGIVIMVQEPLKQ